jgi:hypothetical protein
MPAQLVGLTQEVTVKLESHFALASYLMIKNQCESLVVVELLLDLIRKMN